MYLCVCVRVCVLVCVWCVCMRIHGVSVCVCASIHIHTYEHKRTCMDAQLQTREVQTTTSATNKYNTCGTNKQQRHWTYPMCADAYFTPTHPLGCMIHTHTHSPSLNHLLSLSYTHTHNYSPNQSYVHTRAHTHTHTDTHKKWWRLYRQGWELIRRS